MTTISFYFSVILLNKYGESQRIWIDWLYALFPAKERIDLTWDELILYTIPIEKCNMREIINWN